MYTGEGALGANFLSGLSLYFYGELIASSLGLFFTLLSFYKASRDDLKGYRGVFWLSGIVGYAFLFALGIRGEYMARSVRIYLQTFGVITIEFCFSIVNLALSSTHAIFEMRSPRMEWLWLLYSFSHIPMAMAVSALYVEFHDPRQLLFWNHIWLFVMQLTNLSAFFMHMMWIRKTVANFTLSRKTAAILINVLNRFVDFCLCYCIYMASTCILMVLVIIDVSGAWSGDAVKAVYAALYLYGTARFFTYLKAVYIMRPYWVRQLHSWNAFVFNAATVQTGGLEHRPSAINIGSSASFGKGTSRRDFRDIPQLSDDLGSIATTARVLEEDMKDYDPNGHLESIPESQQTTVMRKPSVTIDQA